MGILLSLEFSRGRLSPRGLGIALLILCIAYGTAAVLIIKKSAKELTLPLGLSGTSIDPATRKLLLRRIRRAKTTIALMGIVLMLALIQIRDFPVLPLLVGLAMNLLITAQSVQTVIRLKKILD